MAASRVFSSGLTPTSRNNSAASLRMRNQAFSLNITICWPIFNQCVSACHGRVTALRHDRQWPTEASTCGPRSIKSHAASDTINCPLWLMNANYDISLRYHKLFPYFFFLFCCVIPYHRSGI